MFAGSQLVGSLGRGEGGFVAVCGTRAGFAFEAGEKGLKDDVKDRNEEKIENSGQNHAADDGSADRVTAVGSGALGEIEWTDAEDKGDGGHEDGAQTKLGGDDGGVDDVLTEF